MCDLSLTKLVAIPEIAREGGMCEMTARRGIAAKNIQPDALLVTTTGRKPPVALFVQSRVPLILKSLQTINQTTA